MNERVDAPPECRGRLMNSPYIGRLGGKSKSGESPEGKVNELNRASADSWDSKKHQQGQILGERGLNSKAPLCLLQPGACVYKRLSWHLAQTAISTDLHTACKSDPVLSPFLPFVFYILWPERILVTLPNAHTCWNKCWGPFPCLLQCSAEAVQSTLAAPARLEAVAGDCNGWYSIRAVLLISIEVFKVSQWTKCQVFCLGCASAS